MLIFGLLPAEHTMNLLYSAAQQHEQQPHQDIPPENPQTTTSSSLFPLPLAAWICLDTRKLKIVSVSCTEWLVVDGC